MPESPPKLPTEGSARTPQGAFRAAWFGGMIEGARASDKDLNLALSQLNQLGLARVELEFDARRFSALIDEQPLLAAEWKTNRLDAFVQGLQSLVAAADDPMAVESNMRCVELYADRAVETLFAVINGQVLCNSQVRETRPSDEEYLKRHRAPLELKHMGRAKKAGLLLASLLFATLFAWQLGLDNLFFPRPAAELQLNTGAFGDLLSMRVEPVFGGYEVILKRGASYSIALDDKAEGNQDLNTEWKSLSAKAALLTVGTGDEAFVRLFNHEGGLLAAHPVFLEELLRKEDAVVSISIPGFRKANQVELSLIGGSVER